MGTIIGTKNIPRSHGWDTCHHCAINDASTAIVLLMNKVASRI